MSGVIFQDSSSGEKIEFSLYEGRVNVANVLSQFNATAVRLKGSNGIQRALEARPEDGLHSTCTFAAGTEYEVVVIQPILPSTDHNVTELLKKLVDGQRTLHRGVCASLGMTLWGEIASTETSETTEDFRSALVQYYGDATDQMNE